MYKQYLENSSRVQPNTKMTPDQVNLHAPRIHKRTRTMQNTNDMFKNSQMKNK